MPISGGDPFAVTHRGAMEGLSKTGEGAGALIGGLLARRERRAKEEREKQEKYDFLKQMGILKPKEPTSKEYIDYAQKEAGKKVTLKGGLSEQNKLKNLQKIFDYFGMPKPQGKGYDVDLNKVGKTAFEVMPGVSIAGKEEQKGGYDKPEDIPPTMGGQPLKSLKQDPDTGKWFAEYGASTNVYGMMGGGGAGNILPEKYTVGEKKTVGGKIYIYIGNNQWQEQ